MSFAQSPVIHKNYSLDEAFDYCATITNAHYENFPVASLFLPEEKRPYVQAIYAFSRVADDFADERDRLPEDRLADLNDWDEKLRQCFEGHVDHPVFIALRETVSQLGLPIEPLHDLLTAFKRDVTQNRYGTFDDLLGYCRCSANPVGRLVLMIFGCREEEMFKLSDDICTALQLTNFWQDVTVDQKKDRLYLPIEDMDRFGYSLQDWTNSTLNDRFRDLMKFEVARTREMFFHGVDLPSRVLKELQFELKLVWIGGMTILKKIDSVKGNVLTQRPSLSTFDKGIILLRGLLLKELRHFGKKRVEWEQE